MLQENVKREKNLVKFEVIKIEALNHFLEYLKNLEDEKKEVIITENFSEETYKQMLEYVCKPFLKNYTPKMEDSIEKLKDSGAGIGTVFGEILQRVLLITTKFEKEHEENIKEFFANRKNRE